MDGSAAVVVMGDGENSSFSHRSAAYHAVNPDAAAAPIPPHMNNSLPKIHFWPNFMTAGNLFCGFFAILHLLDKPPAGEYRTYFIAIGLILVACVFDMLDGLVARAIGEDSPFGREFDSLADIVSFGVAPALLVHHVVLDDFDNDRLGWFIAFFYLLCGAMRLARFNCVAAAAALPSTSPEQKTKSKDFTGCPIPAAAGVVASLTLLLLEFQQNEREIGSWKYTLPPLMILLSWLMFSKLKYPSLKGLNWKTKRTFPWFFAAVGVAALVAYKPMIMPAVLFVGYLFYGLARPWISRRWRREIEEDPDEEPSDEEEGIA